MLNAGKQAPRQAQRISCGSGMLAPKDVDGFRIPLSGHDQRQVPGPLLPEEGEWSARVLQWSLANGVVDGLKPVSGRLECSQPYNMVPAAISAFPKTSSRLW